MLYGRTLFGGPLYPRQVTAAGSAVCSAEIAATATSALRSAAGVFGLTTVATAEALRTAVAAPVVPQGMCDVQDAVAHVEFRPGALPVATAAVQGRAEVEFFLAGTLAAAGVATGKIIRMIRYPVATQFWCLATVEAEGTVYALGDPERAWGIARPFGTYWFVSKGEVAASGVGAADGQRHRAGAIAVQAGALVQGTARVDGNASGAVAAEAAGDPDALLEVGGVRYWSARGGALASAEPTAGAYVYTVALAVARALPTADAVARRAAKAGAICTANGTGSMERVLPQEGSVVIDSSAQGTASARAFANASASAAATGASAAAAEVEFLASGGATASAGGVSNVVWLEIKASATSTGSVVGGAIRHRFGGGQVLAFPTVVGAARLASFSGGQSAGLAMGTAVGGLHPKIPATGAAQAEAQVSGFNTVNEATQRLSTRVIWVGADVRLLIVPRSPRLVTAAGQLRRMAA